MTELLCIIMAVYSIGAIIRAIGNIKCQTPNPYKRTRKIGGWE